MATARHSAATDLERALELAVAGACGTGCPPTLAAAIRHAVFPGGARIRPRLCLAVADALGNPRPAQARAVAAAIELVHCASLVHDDLPCFDDAALRRGRPAVHRAHGERSAVLAGDALIVLAFETLGKGVDGAHVGCLVGLLAGAVGAPRGLCAGQGWESEPDAALAEYHRAKTGGLFAAATEAGALVCGHPGASWRLLGANLGAAYQVADDVKDVACQADQLGKPVGRDAALARPNAVHALGMEGAMTRLKSLVAQAIAAIPDCPGAGALRARIIAECESLVPTRLASRVA